MGACGSHEHRSEGEHHHHHPQHHPTTKISISKAKTRFSTTRSHNRNQNKCSFSKKYAVKPSLPFRFRMRNAAAFVATSEEQPRPTHETIRSPAAKDATASTVALDNTLPGLGMLPIDLLRSLVLPFLEAKCLSSAGGTCTVWRDAALDEQLWKPLCLRRWEGKHVPLLEATVPAGDARGPPAEESNRDGQQRDAPSGAEQHYGDYPQTPAILAESLRHGLEDLVADMSIRTMKNRLQELGANPRRLASCLEKDECVTLLMGSMLLSREGLLREGGQLPPWVSRLRGWRWSYYFANKDGRRCWLTMDDLVRSRWTLSFPAPSSSVVVPLVTCEFHRDFSYTAEWFHPDGLDWHFEDSHRCVKVADYPALEAERDESWGWRLVNAHAIFHQQRPPPWKSSL